MENLKKYVGKSKGQKTSILIVSIIFTVAGIGAIILKKSLIIGIVLVVLGLLTLYGALTSDKADEKNFEKLKKANKLDEAIKDFNNSKSFLDDDIRIGSKYIFRKADSRILAFEDIKDIEYKRSNEKDDMSVSYGLCVTLNDGSWQKLYAERADHKAEAQKIIDIIKK